MTKHHTLTNFSPLKTSGSLAIKTLKGEKKVWILKQFFSNSIMVSKKITLSWTFFQAVCCYRDRCNAHLLAHAAPDGGSTNGNSGGRNNTDNTGGGDEIPIGGGDGNTGKNFLLTFLHDMIITKFLIMYITTQNWITSAKSRKSLWFLQF